MERGAPKILKTFDLPKHNSAEADILEITNVDSVEIVGIAVSYADSIKFTFAPDRTKAHAAFASGDYMVYRGRDNQAEIGTRGRPGNLYIEAFKSTSIIPKGVSYFLIVGGERP